MLRSHQHINEFFSGLAAGLGCSGIMHPLDRALSLSVIEHNQVFSIQHFTHPYHGFTQAIFQRATTSGLYYILENELHSGMYPYLCNTLGTGKLIANFCVGMTLGSCTGLSTNWLSTIRYFNWTHQQFNFFSCVRHMWSSGGIRAFTRGCSTTIARDEIFNLVNEPLRYYLSDQFNSYSNNKISNKSYLAEFLPNAISASFATILSSPINYVRTMQYTTPLGTKTPKTWELLSTLWKASNNYSPFYRIRFLFQEFKTPQSVIRNAIAMPIGFFLFNLFQRNLNTISDENDNRKKNGRDPKSLRI